MLIKNNIIKLAKKLLAFYLETLDKFLISTYNIIVRIKILGAKSSYSCVSRNGISSQNWGYWEGSYIFV